MIRAVHLESGSATRHELGEGRSLRVSAVSARIGRVLVGLLLIVAFTACSAGDDRPRPGSGAPDDVAAQTPAVPADADGPSAETIVIDDCRTWFPYRRRLASERAGILADTPEEGDRFEPGAVVARLSDSVPRAALAAAEKRASNDADVRQAEKAHELAKFSFDRMQAANATRPGTFDADEVRQRELETANAALRVDVARHELEVARLEVEQARAELETYQIRTERGGIVTRVIKHDGEGVQLGEEVLEIVDTSVVRVEGYADAKWLGVLKPGMSIEVILGSPDHTSPMAADRVMAAEIGFVDVSVTSAAEVRLWADCDRKDPLIPEGSVARMYIK